MKELKPDICVIGAGSGGLTVAAAAAAFGVKVVLVEKGAMGGDCLNFGCVPSKAIIAAAKHAHAIGEAPAFGVSAGAPKVDFGRVNRHVRNVIAAIAPNDSVERFTALGVTVVKAEARFADPHTVEADGYRIRARRFVIATGSAPFVPEIPGLAETGFLTNETLFDRTTKPQHLIVIGGGPIGLEMAQAHRRLGAEVTVIEGDRVLAREDPELASQIADCLRREGVTLIETASVKRVERRGKTRIAVLCRKGDDEIVVRGSDILLATGRTPALGGLDLAAAKIAFDEKGVKVGANLKTSNRRVFAIGDAVAGGLQFTHVANYHAGLVVQQILFRLPAREKRHLVPRVTYTDPEIAHVGLGEAEARRSHRRLSVLRWPVAENDRAQAERRLDGEIKVIADRKGRILGASIMAPGAGEMIGAWTLAVTKRMTLGDMRAVIAPYPTIAEIGKRAAISYYAPMTRKPFVRRIVAFLRRFG